MQHACRLFILLAMLIPALSRTDQLPVRDWPAIKRAANELIKPRSILVYCSRDDKAMQIDIWRVISVHSSKAGQKSTTVVCAERLFVSKPALGNIGKATFTAIDSEASAEQRLVVKTIDPANTFVPSEGRSFCNLALEMNLRSKVETETVTLPEAVFNSIARHRETILAQPANNPVLATFNVRGERIN